MSNTRLITITNEPLPRIVLFKYGVEPLFEVLELVLGRRRSVLNIDFWGLTP